MMPTRSFRSRISRRPLLAACAGWALVRVPAASSDAAARQDAANAALLVRGEAELAVGVPLAWRVVRDVAETAPEAAFERRALGFAVASGPFASLLLTDEATGSASRLAPGEAAFVRDGARQRRESLAPRAQAYLRIGLVAAKTAGDAGGDRLLFAGPAFYSPGRAVTLALHRVALEPGEAMGMSPGAGETLVLI